MMKLPIYACVLFASISIRAQTVTPVVLSADGGYHLAQAGSIAWTMGEPVSETYIKTANITTMGFHQTEIELVNFVDEFGQDASEVLVFPNPVSNVLKVNFKGMEHGNYTLNITDAAGKQLMSSEAAVDATTS